MIKVTLGNGEIKEFDAPLSAFDAARELGEAKTACAAEIDGKVCDLRTTLTDGCTVKFLTFEDEQGQRAFNHTASHVLAQAVKRLFPATKLAIGPAIENGFYYDFDTDADDLLTFPDGTEIWFPGKRIANPNTHGTGCTLSSAIAANLAKGFALEEAIARAKAYLTDALNAQLDLGHGSGPLDHTLGGVGVENWMHGVPDAVHK